MSTTLPDPRFQSAGSIAAPPTRPRRILLALNPEEFDLFLPDTRALDSLPVEWIRWPEPAVTGPAWRQLLDNVQPEILLACWKTPPLPAPYTHATASPLKYVCHLCGSVRGQVPRSFLESGGIVTNWGMLAAPIVAEHALLLAMASLRGIHQWRTVLNNLEPAGPASFLQVKTRTIHGRRVGIHGFGRIAQCLVRLLKAFEVPITCYSHGVPDRLMEAEGVTPVHSLEELFAGAELLFECEALTPRSRHSVTAQQLALLPDGAVFINVGRGPTVDEHALYREAASGRIQIAVDVYADEPVRPDCPLFNLPGAVLSPHIGGPTLDRLPVCGQFAIDNIRRYLDGEPLQAIITPEIYDRST